MYLTLGVIVQLFPRENTLGSKTKIALEHETVKIFFQRCVLFKYSFHGYRCISFTEGETGIKWIKIT